MTELEQLQKTLETALKKLGEVYQSAYGHEIGAYDELFIDASSISYFLQANGVDVRALEAEAEGEMEEDRGWSDKSTEDLWELFGRETLDDEERLEESFLDFGAGTHKEAVWRWFDDRHSKGVAYLLNPTQWEADKHLRGEE